MKKTWTQEDQTIREMDRVMDVNRLVDPHIDLLFEAIRKQVDDHLAENGWHRASGLSLEAEGIRYRRLGAEFLRAGAITCRTGIRRAG
ncbi:MAG: hypothetical protein WDN48_01530 [Pseudolabrys sp.]